VKRLSLIYSGHAQDKRRFALTRRVRDAGKRDHRWWTLHTNFRDSHKISAMAEMERHPLTVCFGTVRRSRLPGAARGLIAGVKPQLGGGFFSRARKQPLNGFRPLHPVNFEAST